MNAPAPASGANTPVGPSAASPGATSTTGVSRGAGSGQQSVARQRPAPDLQKRVKAAISLGDYYVNDGKYDAAISAYKEGLKLDPKNEELRFRIGKAMEAKATEERVLKP